MAGRRFASAFAGGALAAGMQRLNARHPWSHNDHFHSWIVANLPERCHTALDVGCGRGELLAVLAPHVDKVIGIDTDATMRGEATRRCAGLLNVSVADGPWDQAAGLFDVVTMVAVLHHLAVEDALRAVRGLLAPGGRFLAVGLAVPRSFRDHVCDVASVVTNPMIGFVKQPWPSRLGPQNPPVPVRDPTMTFDELREALAIVMPEATIRRQLGFRHTIAWTKPWLLLAESAKPSRAVVDRRARSKPSRPGGRSPCDPAGSVVAGVAEVVERGRRVAPASPAVDRLTGGTITSLAGRPAVV